MPVHTLILDRFVPVGLNKTMRGKLKRRIKDTDACHELVAIEAFRQRIPKAKTARRVTFIVTFPSKAVIIDPDNALKCLLDSLKNCGLLIDDDYSHCEIVAPVYYLGAHAETKVRLEDIPVKTIERVDQP